MERRETLYDPRFEHDSCGIGGVVHIGGQKSHDIVSDGLKIVERMAHRAGRDASGETGDGVGIMTQVPHDLFRAVMPGLGEAGDYGVGMLFLPPERLRQSRLKRLLQVLGEKQGLPFLGWRQVPVCPEVLGQRARGCMPYICQCFWGRPEGVARGLDFDRRLYVLRRAFEQSAEDGYVVSLSSRTIVYKGMFLVHQLRRFYPDLQDERYTSAMALVHSRFSTNTDPSWQRAHPNRLILHNGEINTIRGNIDRMLAREETMHTPLLEEDMDTVLPVIDQTGSDSAVLDNVLEFLMFSGMPLPKALMVTIPEPWRKNQDMAQSRREMYHYYATMMEPWDGPAAVLFSDGDLVGAVLDRNGLRPARYCLTTDDRLILSSEVGVLELPPETILRKDRLRPGQLLVADLTRGRLLEDEELKSAYAARHPYGQWLEQGLVRLETLPEPASPVPEHTQAQRDRLYKTFGYSYETIRKLLLPMAMTGAEPTNSMGADIPLAVLSERDRSLFSYFRQLFAQVTNPPIDPIREAIVTDTTVYAGSDGNLLEDTAQNCRVLQMDSPILTIRQLQQLRSLDMPGLRSRTVSLLYHKNSSLERAMERLFTEVDKAYRQGANILILSDRGTDENHTAIPSLLAVAGVESHLVRTRKRTAVSVILDSAEPCQVHHFATLLGYGARAVCPYLAQECICEMIGLGLLERSREEAVAAYGKAVLDGVVKIAAKMGISALQSYQSAQIFEAVGIRQSVIDRYFTGTVSRVGGIGLEEIAQSVIARHDRAFDPMGLNIDLTTDSVGFHQLRSGEGTERHLYDPVTILTLQEAVRDNSWETFQAYTRRVDEAHRHCTLRGLLDIRRAPIPLERVEPESAILRRFKTGAMSYGSISREAHGCLAEAMNRLGGSSNSGEGGEETARLGTDRGSAIKQVASGRFGVTAEYLVSAREIQIKMAQGAKPGEGGHLPGAKVWPWVADTRHSTPGVGLISPPPHHDIYSIEDLAQLIYDLKQVNPRARVSVKLVSEAGVGTIAVGVAKAGAQVILISGADGGTGAAPNNSIYNAGLPWELGLAETHQALLRSGLRGRVTLETDGKLMTGRDVVIACLLGAQEFGFATAPLVAMGCRMMRVCHLDTCPMGIATQDPRLRNRFRGKPEHVEHFMRLLARQVRQLLAELGAETMEELVGRTDLLVQPVHRGRAGTLELSALLAGGRGEPFVPATAAPRDTDDPLLAILETDARVMEYPVTNTHRAVGTRLGAELVRRYSTDLAPDSYRVRCVGGAGQSFGAFIPRGLTLELEGDANDYFGKGLSGGTLAVYPNCKSRFRARDNVIIGNVALYGATGGRCYICGMAGERFAVRNSGAVAVVEGVGDHGCEYMTGGTVLILGKTGRNFAAGMSGGIAYVLDEDDTLCHRLNGDLVTMEPVTDERDRQQIWELLREHVQATGSQQGRQLLRDFDRRVKEIKKIVPGDYARMVSAIQSLIESGVSPQEARLRAFRGEEA